MNAIQCQTSCGIFPLNTELMDQNWIKLWNGYFDEDLVKRINAMIAKGKDVHAINMCAFERAGLHFYVNNKLMRSKIWFFEAHYPACNWMRSDRRKIY